MWIVGSLTRKTSDSLFAALKKHDLACPLLRPVDYGTLGAQIPGTLPDAAHLPFRVAVIQEVPLRRPEPAHPEYTKHG